MRRPASLADLIDAAEVGVDVAGDSGSGGYTTAAWVTGVGKGLTVTPAKGDTSKKLFIPNAGRRPSNGTSADHGTALRFWSAAQSSATFAWRILYSSSDDEAFGQIAANHKVWAESLRCVRS